MDIEVGGYTEFNGDTFAIELKRWGQVVGVVPEETAREIESIAELETERDEAKEELEGLKEEHDDKLDELKSERDSEMDDVRGKVEDVADSLEKEFGGQIALDSDGPLAGILEQLKEIHGG